MRRYADLHTFWISQSFSFLHAISPVLVGPRCPERFPEKTIQEWIELHIAKILKQLKNISSYKICDKHSLHDSGGEGMKVLLALTQDSLHSC